MDPIVTFRIRNPLPDIRAVLFDKDGTLVDFEKTWAEVNRGAARIGSGGDIELEARLLDICGVDPETGRTRADSLFAAGTAITIAERMAAEGSPVAADLLAAELEALFASAADNAVAVGDIAGLFGALRGGGLHIGIASNDSESSVRRTARALGVLDLVHFTCGYDSGFGAKPAPGMVHGFAEAMGMSSAEVAVVGDSRHDMEMARAAGAGAAIGVLTGAGTAETLGPVTDAVLASVMDLPAAILPAAPDPEPGDR